MYVGKFRDIDNTLYTVKLKHRDEVEVDKPTITLDIAEYINLNHGYVSYGVHAVYENRDASFTYQGKTYTARIFRVTEATNDGAPLTQLFV